MTGQKQKIIESLNFIKSKSPFKKNPELAIITYKDPLFLKEFQVLKKLSYKDIPPKLYGNENSDAGEFIFAKLKGTNKNLYILNGRFHFYSGYKMRDVVHPIYILKELGVKKIILIDEVGYLNPRFELGGVSFIYDHINLMGDNPLIGENDSSLGTRFPDMSNAYDKKLFDKVEELLKKENFTYYPSVYIGVLGPESETESECRFYREIYSDVLGYGIVPENIAALHSGIKILAFGMISRELVADRLKAISKEEQLKNRVEAEKYFSKILKEIINYI